MRGGFVATIVIVGLVLGVILILDQGLSLDGLSAQSQLTPTTHIHGVVVLPGRLRPVGPAGRWKLAFDDEFPKRSLNKAKWYPTCPWSGTNYVCTAGDGSLNCFDPRNAFVHTGTLYLRVERRTLRCVGRVHKFDGAWIATDHWSRRPHFAFTYGYLEARIRMPDASGGHGYWAGFWSGAVNGDWPPEMEVAEWQSNYPTIVGLYYHYKCGSGHCVAGTNYNARSDLSAGWHIYGVDWEPHSVTWYVDGRRVYTWSGTTTRTAMDIRLSLEVNGSWDRVSPRTAFPQSMLVDYVRVWRH
ncbi:MAG TPA: glycoside hydrolase family 16 protein [Chloroflexota bacterium]|nr:glycoside hydrolase family 16 protein [Chloroflexota bacterium]